MFGSDLRALLRDCTFVLSSPFRSMKLGEPPTEERLSAARLRSVYGRDYYHGATSGYPTTGYATAHPDWTAWLNIIRGLKGEGLFVDLGCAYGYLVEAACARGFQAVGADISRYALGQEESLRERLVEAHLDHLPFRSGSASVVCVFDVLEHLQRPRACLAECARLLGPDGLLVGATPDPLRFERDESSHLCERPPSYWLAALRRLGLQYRFRFSNEAYNFQFLAAPAGSETWARLEQLPQGGFGPEVSFFCGDGPIEIASRDGWLESTPAAGLLPQSGGALYLLNPTPSPLQLKIDLRLASTPAFSTLQLRLDSVVLAEVQLTTEQTHYHLTLDTIPLTAGGHHLWFELQPPGPAVSIANLTIGSTPLDAGQLTAGLPFDLFQRYQLAGAISEVLCPGSILDVGGVLGDIGGHLASSSDFFGAERNVVSTDLRHCDHPGHEIADGGLQPFQDQSFDLVVSMDVLEHLPPADRESYLAELRRVARLWIIVAAPINDPAVQKAEETLGDSLLAGHAFLAEHAQMGLPRAREVSRSFETAGWNVVEMSNGYLPYWLLAQALTQVLFAGRDFETWRHFNRLYSRHFYPHDQQEPAYRRFWVASRTPLEGPQKEELDRLARPASGKPLELLADDGELIELLLRSRKVSQRRLQALNEAQFIANARSEGLEILREELEHTPLLKLALRRLRRRRKV